MKLDSLFRLGRRPHRRALDEVKEYATVVGPGSVFSGTLAGKDNYVVHGRVEGDCDLQGSVVVMEQGVWQGDIVATNVTVNGTLHGNVTAKGKLELGSNARIEGDITSPVIAIAEGARYDGEIRMAKQTQVLRYSERRGAADRNKSETK